MDKKMDKIPISRIGLWLIVIRVALLMILVVVALLILLSRRSPVEEVRLIPPPIPARIMGSARAADHRRTQWRSSSRSRQGSTASAARAGS